MSLFSNNSVYSALFFFNYTATTEIYTYLHTLSLHAALPICTNHPPPDPCPSIPSPCLSGRSAYERDRITRAPPWINYKSDRNPRQIGRAQSELQSLMRISYAVFCLKKKNNIARITTRLINKQDNIEHRLRTYKKQHTT